MEVRRLADLKPAERSALVERDAGVGDRLEAVRDIVRAVRDDGDEALRRFSREFDGVDLDRIDVSGAAATAFDAVDPAVRDAIEDAAANVRAFHERQVPEDWRAVVEGRELGRRFRPIERVGVYAPGGTAAYPSSAIMGVVPATVAGVPEVVVATPPGEPPNEVTLAAIHAAGADEVYAVGGAQAVAALAYGTETVDPVEKIVGPGSPWVTAAKAVVRNDVAIDFLAGPSEILVLADGTADPAFVAADLVAQAEHGPTSPVLAVTDDPDIADGIAAAVDRQAAETGREAVVGEALSAPTSGILVADSMADAADFADAYAPEHLSIQADDDEALLSRIDSAGSVFLGPYTPVAAGDYASGTNHVLPTGGGARVTGGLSVETFLRATTVQRLDRDALSALSDTISTLAEAEGLPAHADSVTRRLDR